MGWIQRLYETYNNCEIMIGFEENESDVPLLPISHTTQKAQINVVIDGHGNFVRAFVIPKENARTIIPSSEKSSGRTSAPSAHPLFDKLQYIAGDYKEFGGSKKSHFDYYFKSLQAWCESEYSDPKIMAVFKYIQKKCLIEDLTQYKILFLDENKKLIKKWEKKKDEDVPHIFNVTTSQEDAFVRWQVEIPGDPESRLWKDKKIWNKWIEFYTSLKKEKAFCYATGQIKIKADQHLAKIRTDGDKAKIISSNDSSGFTYRGRFLDGDQAMTLGYEVTQKAHLALRWLLSRQGYLRGDLAVLAWATSGASIPRPLDDSLSVIGLNELPSEEFSEADTAQQIALNLKKKIAGYHKELGDTTNIVVMEFDSATTGRLSVSFYRELTGSDFLQRINDWHETCSWKHTYISINEPDKSGRKGKRRVIPFIGAPAPVDIAEAAYGSRLDDKLKKATIKRLLPCIIDGQQIPRDLMESTVRRASNRISMDYWEWNKTLSIACALVKKYNEKENYQMALDVERKTRDYLYGRLLALADNIEEWALSEAGEKRGTNAARLMQRFSERPYSTWETIELSLAPSKARLGKKASSRLKLMDEIMALFEPEDFINDKRLSGEFLLGYHCQRDFLRNQFGKKADELQSVADEE